MAGLYLILAYCSFMAAEPQTAFEVFCTYLTLAFWLIAAFFSAITP